MIFEFLFWGALGTLVYVYFGFILILLMASKIKGRPVVKKDILPSVSIIISAHNEEKHIERKIENCMNLDYPKDRMEIVVVSDGSTDRTNAILGEIRNPLLKAHFMPQAQGKTECQNAAVEISNHDVLFFTDATVMHPENALRLLVKSLHDPSVGCVTGKPIFNRDEGATSKGLSKRDQYELYLRSKLGDVHSLFGAQDCIYVIPRRLYSFVKPDLDSGFVGPLKILEKGYRTVYEPEALAFVDRPAPRVEDEFARRSRIVLRGMRGLIHMRQLMNPFKHGCVALSLVSTRLLRWLSPVFISLLFLSNLFLLDSPFYLVMFVLQLAFYLVAFIAFLLERRGYLIGSIFYIPLYFCTLTLAATVGLKKLLAGETGQVWQTRR